MVTHDKYASLLGKIEAILPKLDGTKSALQADMADCLIALRFLLRKPAITTNPNATGLKKPIRDRAIYMRGYRLRVKAARSLPQR